MKCWSQRILLSLNLEKQEHMNRDFSLFMGFSVVPDNIVLELDIYFEMWSPALHLSCSSLSGYATDFVMHAIHQ